MIAYKILLYIFYLNISLICSRPSCLLIGIPLASCNKIASFVINNTCFAI